MLNEVKHLAYVSCQVLARDPSCRQDDNRRRFCFVDNIYIITIIFIVSLFLFRVIHDKLTVTGEAFGTDVKVFGSRVVIECD